MTIEPATDPGKRGAAYDIEQRPDNNGYRDDDRQHQQSINTAARQNTIIDLKKIEGGSKQKNIVAATIGEDQTEGTGTPTQGSDQWGHRIARLRKCRCHVSSPSRSPLLS